MAETVGDSFWGDDYSILFNQTRLSECFPSSEQTLEERVNSISRLVIYISLGLALYAGKTTTIHFGLIILILIYFMWKNQTIHKLNDVYGTQLPEHFLGNDKNAVLEKCVMPTPENPFMNFLLGDSPDRAPACKASGVQEMAANLLDKQLFSDVDDLFSRNSNSRLFNTTPGTLPRAPTTDERQRFSDWMVNGTTSCKTDTTQCFPYDDVRLQRQLLPEEVNEDEQDATLVDGFTL